MEYYIKEITTHAEMLAQVELLQQLNPNIEHNSCSQMLRDMIANNYKMIGAFVGEVCVGISGYWIGTKLYSGKYLEMDNVVVDEGHRSARIGAMLCDYLDTIAKENNCQMMMLDAYIENEKAHRFYEREGYTKRGYHFIKKL
ncbi:MAG: GNAT family N-acetyltransferase [Bacteroidota bacterium]|nr:GNAT family N-acetyltransferase [Bacteroidota bacterium]